VASFKIIVQKFGGTSVEDAAAMRRSMDIVIRYGVSARTRPLVVLSACAGVTNELIKISELSIRSDTRAAKTSIDALEARHARIARELLGEDSEFERVHRSLHELWEGLRLLSRGVHLLGELTPKNRDQFQSIGERASSTIFAAALGMRLDERSIKVNFLDAREFFMTTNEFTAARPLVPETSRRIKKIAQQLGGGAVGVTQGFIGSNADGEVTTIGRGGSDFSAAIMGVAIAAHVKVPEIQIWTDVAGILTCDPRLVKRARALDRVSFGDASELAFFGAKVLHPETIWPAVERGIPVRVLSSKEPRKAGTTITAKAKGKKPITGIALLKDVIVVHLSSNSVLPNPDLQQGVWDALNAINASPVAVSFAVGSAMYVFRDPAAVSTLRAAVEGRTDLKVEHGRSLITLVGPGLHEHSGIAARLFHALGRANCEMISYGGSRSSISVLVSTDAAPRAIQHLHAEFF
jgi:aspartate kinase